MGKITIILNDEVEDKLRRYISKKWPLETFGKITNVIETALQKFLATEE